MDFTKVKKVLADRWSVAGGMPFFHFGFSYGNEESAYVMPAQAAKGLWISLGQQIKEVEKKIGQEIDMEGYEMGTLAPFQPDKP